MAYVTYIYPAVVEKQADKTVSNGLTQT